MIEHSLGSGATGAVYAAMDTLLDRLVALKILNRSVDEGAHRARVLREAASPLGSSTSESRVYDVGEHHGRSSWFVRGPTLRTWG